MILNQSELRKQTAASHDFMSFIKLLTRKSHVVLVECQSFQSPVRGAMMKVTDSVNDAEDSKHSALLENSVSNVCTFMN